MNLEFSERMRRLLICALVLIISQKSFGDDTLQISSNINEIELHDYIYIYEDPTNELDIDKLLHNHNYTFEKNNNPKLNFEFSSSTFWLKVNIKNNTNSAIDYLLEIPNPDLDYVSFYETLNKEVRKTLPTGELRDISSREIKHRNFLFSVQLMPDEVRTIYVSTNNNGHSFYVPIRLRDTTFFFDASSKIEIINWLIYGILLFIIIFNFYLYRTSQDKVNLYYSFYVIIATLFFFYNDGYYYFFNPPAQIEKLKLFLPGFYTIFLLLFTQSFIETNIKFKRIHKTLNPIKIIAFFSPFFYMLPFPFSLVADVGIPLLILITFLLLIFLAFINYDKKFAPSRLFLYAYLAVFVGLLIYELKELNIIPTSFFVENTPKFGQTAECILLTIAILERFRITQENAKKLIEESHKKIELQNKELEIINSELEKLSIVASETDNSVAIYDKSGRIEWCNEGFEKFYETDINKLIQQKTEFIEEIIPFKDVKDLFKKCVEEKEAVIYEAQLKFNGKGNKWIHTTLSPYIKGHKVIAVDTDITNLKEYEADLKKAKDKAEESDRIKTIFLSNMSHEVRTPLNGILGFSELLNQEGVSREERERFVEIIKSNGEQLIRIIDDILDMSLIETNQLKIWNSDLSLTQLCEELVDFFEFYKTSVGKPDVKLISEFNINEESDFIHSDSSRLKQVLMNLLKNGFKFTDKGYVKFGCSANEDNILFFVEDTGIGIEPSKIEDVFKRFRQADERTTRKYGGNGLGLSISRGILEKMGGEIWIDPEYKLGFRICFVIPLNLAKKSGKKNETEKQQNFKFIGKNILIVEDHDISFQYLEDLFKPFSTKIHRAINGIEAIQKVKENHFDLVLMDINLPVLDGIEATKEVRKFNNDIPIIAQTAYAMSTEKDTILKSGCNDVISKPINSEKLFEKIEMFM